MSWTVILTLLVLALSFAALVFVSGWGVFQAGLVVASSAIGLALILIAGTLFIAPKEDRATFLDVLRNTIRQDLQDIARWIGLR